MSMKGDYILVSFMNEFENLDHNDFENALREIKPSFSDDNEYKKDLQIIIDENYINH